MQAADPLPLPRLQAAIDIESIPAGEVAGRVMRALRSVFEPKGVEVPAPLAVAVTAWHSDPLTGGAYSSLTPGSRGGVEYDRCGRKGLLGGSLRGGAASHCAGHTDGSIAA